MVIGKVVGHLWATRKNEELSGFKLLVVKQMGETQGVYTRPVVAADMIGAGIGDVVLMVKGASARHALQRPNAPVDTTIVGIIDEIEMQND